jgi:hypothetical protein
MGKINDITGQRFDKLVAIEYIKNDRYGKAIWLFKCDCGDKIEKLSARVLAAKNNSCGCSQLKVTENQRFGKLVAICSNDKNFERWICRCDCGIEKEISKYDLLSGKSKSCGCVRYSSTHSTKHGMSNTSIYNIYLGIKDRCLNPNSRAYHNYGGRGIKMCERWQNSFEHFLEDMGARPAGHSIDRIDNDGDYTLENCRWTTRYIQSRNYRRNINIEYNSVKYCLTDFCKHIGKSRSTVYKWIKSEVAISEFIQGAKLL